MKYLILIVVLVALLGAGWFVLSGVKQKQTEPTETVLLYYYDVKRDTDASGMIKCSRDGLVSIQRTIPASRTNEERIDKITRLLIDGNLSEDERGFISTEFPLPGLDLISTDLAKDGTLTLTFSDPQNKTGGGSCRVGILWFQIEATAEQFPEVKSARFMPEELFQP